MLLHTCIVLFWVLSSQSHVVKATIFNLSLPHQHPFPDTIAEEVQRRVNESTTRRLMLSVDREGTAAPPCLTGNPIDDCWRCDQNWQSNRQSLADCGIGFGHDALGGKGGRIYVVNDSSDDNPADPKPGTLRHAVIQDEPLWITFSGNMLIKLSYGLFLNSFKTIDGRGADVHIAGHGCVTVESVSNVIIHNVHIHNCKPSGSTKIRYSPTRVGAGGQSDGDGISITSSHKIWVDHCSLSYCADGLIDVVRGSTGITISNNYFSHHDKVMLFGHDDGFSPDSGMQVTVAFNHFGEKLVERMPRCRHGYIHVVNNDYTQWGMYAVGGSASPTINSQGNRYVAPADHDAKEVTKRMDTDKDEWADWNWRSEGDIMVNGAFFVPSGAGASAAYSKASSLAAKSAAVIDQLTVNAGVLGAPRDGGSDGGTVVANKSDGGDDGYYGWIIRGDAAPPPPSAAKALFLSLLTILILRSIACGAMIYL